MVSTREFTYPSSDGVHKIHAVAWQPLDGAPKAVVQIVHGISEYILRYHHFARYLSSHGFLVVGNDHLGHGKSVKGPHEYGYFGPKNGWTHIVDDVQTLRVLTGERYPGLPYFLLGHSMGSFAARTYLIRYPATVDGCLLSGTGQEAAPLVALGRVLTAILSKVQGPNTVSPLVTSLTTGAYNRRFKPTRTDADWISRDRAAVDAYVADPLCSFVPTVGMVHEMMVGLQFIAKPGNLARMDQNTPVYLFSGDQDPVGGDGKGVRKVAGFFQSAGVKEVTLKLYPGCRHETLNELNRDKVYADVLDWLTAHLARH